MDTGILTRALNAFKTVGTTMLTGMAPEASAALALAVSMAWILFIFVWMVDGRPALSSSILKLLLTFTFFGYAVAALPRVAPLVFHAAGATGLNASGNSQFSLDDPSGILDLGLVTAGNIMTRIGQLCTWTDFIGNIPSIVIYLLIWGVVVVTWTIVAFQVLIISSQFYLLLPVALVAIAFGAWGPSSHLAEKGLGYVIGSAGKILAMGIVLGGATLLVAEITQANATGGAWINFKNSVMVAIVSTLLAVFAWMLPHIVGDMFGKGPSLGFAGSFAALAGMAWAGRRAAGTAAAVASGGAGVTMMAARMAAGAAKGAAGAARQGGAGGAAATTANMFRAAAQGASQAQAAAKAARAAKQPNAGGAWLQAPTQNQQRQASQVGADISGLNRGQASAAIEMAGGPASQWPAAQEWMAANRDRSTQQAMAAPTAGTSSASQPAPPQHLDIPPPANMNPEPTGDWTASVPPPEGSTVIPLTPRADTAPAPKASTGQDQSLSRVSPNDPGYNPNAIKHLSPDARASWLEIRRSIYKS